MLKSIKKNYITYVLDKVLSQNVKTYRWNITNMLFSDLKTTGVDKVLEEDEKNSKTESNEYLMMYPL